MLPSGCPHIAKAVHLFAGLALALRRMGRRVSLLAELAPALSSRTAEVPHEKSFANSSIAKSTGKTGNGGLELDGARLQALY